MGDLFYYGKSFHVEEHHIRQSEIFKIMKGNPRHTYLLLTKRPENMAWWTERFIGWWGSIPGNWWLGVSVEDQKTADERIPILLQIPAAKRFVSVEPMLGPIDVSKWLNAICCYKCGGPLIQTQLAGCHTYDCKQCGPDRRAAEVKDCLDWVILGGETGPGARPLHPDWVKSLRGQCQAVEVPFFFKGWGEWFPVGEKLAGEFKPIGKGDAPKRLHLWPDRELSMRTGRKAAGRLLDGKIWEETPCSKDFP
jgi:protein gp37